MKLQFPSGLAAMANAFKIPITRSSRSIPSHFPTPIARSSIATLPSISSSSSSSSPLPPSSITRQICKNTVIAARNTSTPNATRSFSTSTSLAARKKNDTPQRDRRITLIRYFLYHPLTPSPLRFSRNRYLRHWTIHRAWQLHLAKRRKAHQLELQRQYSAMQAANEELRTGAGDGGWLFKRAMSKHKLFKGPVPIEYGRLQTETPSRLGWNYEWKRDE